MTVRTSVLWKMIIHMAKKWPENVVQRSSLFEFSMHLCSIQYHMQGVPSISTQFWFPFIIFLMSYQKYVICQKEPKRFNLDFATLIFTKFKKLSNFFTRWKNCQKNCASSPPLPELHIGILFFRLMYPRFMEFWFQFLTFLIVLSKKTRFEIKTQKG